MAKTKKKTRRFLKQQQKMDPKTKGKLLLSKKIKKRSKVKGLKAQAKDMLEEKAESKKRERDAAEVATQKASVDDLLECDFFGESDSEEGFKDIDGDEPDADSDEGDYNASEHAAELESLKNSDPGFYKWLQENDGDLLNFQAPEESDDEEDKKSKGEENVLTEARFEKLKSAALDKSLRAFRILMAAFRSAVQLTAGRSLNDRKPNKNVADRDNKAALDRQRRETRAKVDDELREMQTRILIHIPDDDVIRAVIAWMCETVSALLDHHLGKRVKKARNNLDIAAFKNGKKCARIGKAFWCEALMLLKKSDPDVQQSLLEACAGENMQRFLWPCAKLRKLVQKEISLLWSTSTRHRVRLVAFLFLRNALAFPAHVPRRDGCDAEEIVRLACKMFAHAAEKGYTWRSVDGFRFLENGLVELLKTDDQMAYRVGYAYIRQLALVLRNASHTATKTNTKEKKTALLYSWSFVRSLYCWTHIVCSIEGLRPLAYPLMMVLTGAVKSQILSLHYYPYVFHCLRCLNTLGSRLEQYVPISSYVLRMLSNVATKFDKAQMNSRQQKALSRAGDVEVHIHFSQTQLENRQTMDHIASMTMQLLADHLGVLARTPAFPELVQPVLLHLRKMAKNLHSETFRRDIKTFVAAAESSVSIVRAARDTLPFNDKFVVFDKVPLAELRSQWLAQRASELTQRISSEGTQKEKKSHKEHDPSPTQLSKRQQKRLRQAKRLAEAELAATGTVSEKKKKRKAAAEDVIEQMVFSDDEPKARSPRKRKPDRLHSEKNGAETRRTADGEKPRKKARLATLDA